MRCVSTWIAVITLVFASTFAGCLGDLTKCKTDNEWCKVERPDREPDLLFEGTTPRPAGTPWGHTFTVPEHVDSVTGCFDFTHEGEVMVTFGPFKGVSPVYMNKTEPFCARVTEYLEDRDWLVRMSTYGEGEYTNRIWWT